MVLNLNEYTQCNYYFGNVSSALLRLISNGRPHELFLDIGANIGLYSLAASNLFWKVIAFEPDPRSLPALKENITRSNACNVTVAPVALSDKSGTAALRVDPLNQGGSSLNVPGGSYSLKAAERDLSNWKSHSLTQEAFSVQTETLDAYLAKSEAHNIRLVKIDVEGHEESVLIGATAMLQRERPVLFVEVSTWDRVKKVLALLPPGYSAYEPYAGMMLDDTTHSGMKYSDVIFSTTPLPIR